MRSQANIRPMCAVQDSFNYWTAARRRIDYPIRECPVWRKATGGSGSQAAIGIGFGELPESWVGTVGAALVVVARHEGAALAGEEVEVRAFVRLQHVIEVQAPVAALEGRLRRLPFFPTGRKLLLRDEQLQPALRDVELDLVAVFDERERAARRRFRRDVQHHRAVGRAA